MSLKVLSNFIDLSVIQPNNFRIPKLELHSVNTCCRVINYAIRTKSKVFIYGDYDVDGMMSMLVWKSVLSSIGYNNYVLYQYTARTHKIPNDLLQQILESGATHVIICDTGSSEEDRLMIRKLKSYGIEVIVIDHHRCSYGYSNMQREVCCFNSREESDALNNELVSGAYASLLVANVLCSDYLNALLSIDAGCFALASMYSDVVDLSTNIGIALYNNVVLKTKDLPDIFRVFNTRNYRLSRRLFQYILSPCLNNCFRTGEFDLLNNLLIETDIFRLDEIVQDISSKHDEIKRLINILYESVHREQYGTITVCYYKNNKLPGTINLSSFTGLVANRIAAETGGAVIALTDVETGYKGSFRDKQGRDFLTSFSTFADVGGHPPAFGISIPGGKYDLFMRNIKALGDRIIPNIEQCNPQISSIYIKNIEDIHTLALYNEYMNTRGLVYLNIDCEKAVLKRKTQWYKYYDVGLPEIIKTTTPVISQTTLTVEPCITNTVELREVIM